LPEGIVQLRRFFREHDAFLTAEERQSNALTRLDARYHAIIEHGFSAIDGARILDIASHNGRWSVAALQSGALHVVGIEARRELVEAAKQHMRRYGVDRRRYEFVIGDVHTEITRLEPDRFDTILCLGFFYHTAHHFWLLREFARLEPKYLILDTAIDRNPGYTITMTREETANRLMAVGEGPLAWTGRISSRLLEDALLDAGFELSYFDWGAFVRNLKEPCPGVTETRYGDGTRVTIHASRRHAPAPMSSTRSDAVRQ
jgi:Methyltransferase domain